MGTKKQFRVRNAVPVGNSPYRDDYAEYRLYLVYEDDLSNWGKKPEYYLLTRETFSQGQAVAIDKDNELVDPQTSERNFKGIRTFIFRPERFLDGNYQVKEEVMSGDLHGRFSAVDPVRHRLYTAWRKAGDGYREHGPLTYIFSKEGYQRGETIPSGELKMLSKVSGTPNANFYLHDDKAYRDRLWAAIKASCR